MSHLILFFIFFLHFLILLELNYAVTYAQRDFHDESQVDCLPDNIILLA